MSVRSAVALEQGADESLLAAASAGGSDPSVLSPVQRAALLLADSYLTHPAAMTDEDRRSIAAELDPVQTVELVVKLMTYSSDKVMVALGLDLAEPTRLLID